MKPGFDTNMTMDEIMREWPQAIPVILRRHMLCVGCPIASFHTLADAAREHGMDEATLGMELRAVMAHTD
jgi:hybrid cluster-associated redox disulfide protein